MLVACATDHEPPPIGAAPAGPESYPVSVARTSVNFSGHTSAQTRDGIRIRLAVSRNHSQLYYRYDVRSKASGKYLVYMPNPPRVYTVYRIPFYRNDVDTSIIRVTLVNHSPRVLNTSHAVCAFDLGDQTVLTKPLGAGGLLPGHTLTVTLKGPTLSQLKGHQEMTVWIYQIGPVKDDKGELPFKWTLPYTLTVTTSERSAKLIGESTSESGVKRYEGLIEPARAGT